MLNRILPMLAVMAAMGSQDGSLPELSARPARHPEDDRRAKAKAKAIADAEAALTPAEKAERQRQNNQRTNLTKRERQALRKGK